MRPVKHKEGDCAEVTEVTVKLPMVDTNATETLSLMHILQIYSMCHQCSQSSVRFRNIHLLNGYRFLIDS